jgi:hypothetical protein
MNNMQYLRVPAREDELVLVARVPMRKYIVHFAEKAVLNQDPSRM